MPRVVLLSDVYYPFTCGVAKVVDILSRELPKYGVRTTLVVPAYTRAAYNIRIQGTLRVFGIKSVGYVPIYREMKIPEITLSYILMRRLLGVEFGCETVFHAHSPYVLLSLLRIASKFRGVKTKVVFTYHTIVSEYLKNGVGFFGRLLIGLDKVVTGSVINRSSIVITPTYYSMRMLIDHLPKYLRRLSAKMIRIPNPLDRRDYEQPRRSVTEYYSGVEEYNYALWVGRISHEKRPTLLMGLFKHLPYKLVIVGKGPLLHSLKRLAPDNVLFTGYVEEEVLKSLLRYARCFIIANSFDNLPLAVMEAMAQGVPIISYYLGGHNEYIRHGENGFKFRDVRDARKYIVRLFKSDDLRDEMGEEARKTALMFHPDRVIPMHISLYRKVLS